MTKTLEKFFEDLGFRESGGDYKVVNNIGFLGKYQMGEMALVDAGYYKPKANIKDYNNDCSKCFTIYTKCLQYY